MDILTLLRANLRHKKGNFISVLLLMLIVSTMLTSVISTQTNMKNRVCQANENVNSGDLVVFFNDKDVNEKMISDIQSNIGVKDLSIKQSIVPSTVYINNEKLSSITFLVENDLNKYPYEVFSDKVDSFITPESELKDNEIYLPVSMKKSYYCQKGDIVKIELTQGNKEFIIKGFIEEPFMGSDVMGVKQFLINKKVFNELYSLAKTNQKDELINNPLLNTSIVQIFATDEYKTKIEQLSKELNDRCNVISLSYCSLTLNQSETYTLLISNILCGVLIAFSVILLIIVILVLSNSIRTSIDMEYVNIGILKSQGFTKGKIRLVLLIQYLLSAIIGSIGGIILAIPIVKLLRSIFIQTSGLLFSDNLSLLKSVLIITAILVLLGIIIFLKTKKVSRISPVMAISGGLENIYFKSTLQTSVISKHKAFINTKLGLRQLTSNVRQYSGTFLIISLLVLFLCLSASFKQTFTEKYYNELFGVKSCDIVVTYNENYSMRNEVEKSITDINSIKNSFFNGSEYYLLDSCQYNCQILDDTSFLTSVLKGRAPKYDNEIVITNKVSKHLGKYIGDKVQISDENIEEQFIISGIYDSCCDTGQCFAMILNGARKLSPDIKISVRNYVLQDSSKATQIIDSTNNNYSTYKIKADTYSVLRDNSMKTVIDGTNIMIYFIYFISIIFAIIVVSMVCSKTFLKEQHDIGIYKAFGFTSFNLKLQFCIRFLLISILGGMVGTVIYIFFGNEINATVLSLSGVSNFHAELTFFNVVLPGLIICLFVLIASVIVMNKIKRVDTKCLIVE